MAVFSASSSRCRRCNMQPELMRGPVDAVRNRRTLTLYTGTCPGRIPSAFKEMQPWLIPLLGAHPKCRPRVEGGQATTLISQTEHSQVLASPAVLANTSYITADPCVVFSFRISPRHAAW